MRETVTIQVGQCGNQIGNYFWTLLLREQHEYNLSRRSNSNDSVEMPEAFFRYPNKHPGQSFDDSYDQDMNAGNYYNQNLKARALLIDMECGPLQETMRGPLGYLFDDTQFVMDVYGSGNNFTHGHYLYGPKYRDTYEEGIRRNLEHCDAIQNFMITHSLGGGTGSGVGTYMLKLLHELHPKICRFSVCVFPSESDDDVVTSPYNSILASQQLIEHADCVFPLDNHALQGYALLEQQQRLIADKRYTLSSSGVNAVASDTSNNSGNNSSSGAKGRGSGFDEMNSVAARMMCHLTSSHRFPGELNVDVNDICTNLIPYPQLHFLTTALSPQRATGAGGINGTGLSTTSFGVQTPDNSSGSRTKVGGVATKRTSVYNKSVTTPRTRSGVYSSSGSNSNAKPVLASLPSDLYLKILTRGFADLLNLPGQLTSVLPIYSAGTAGSHASSQVNTSSVMLASAFLCRGPNVPMSDFINCVCNAQKKMLFPTWNADACKIGLCSVPASNETVSLLGIYNTTSFGDVFGRERRRFNNLFKRRAMLHHYTEYIEYEDVAHADRVVADVYHKYQAINRKYGNNYTSATAANNTPGAHSTRSPSSTPQKALESHSNNSIGDSPYKAGRSPGSARDRNISSDPKYNWSPIVFPAF